MRGHPGAHAHTTFKQTMQVVNYRSGDTNQRANAVEIAETIAAMGCDALVAPCDVSKEPEVQRLAGLTVGNNAIMEYH